MANKKAYQKPELFDLSSTEAIGACTIGGQVSVCTTGGVFGTGVCETGNGVKPLDCAAGADAWQKRGRR